MAESRQEPSLGRSDPESIRVELLGGLNIQALHEHWTPPIEAPVRTAILQLGVVRCGLLPPALTFRVRKTCEFRSAKQRIPSLLE